MKHPEALRVRHHVLLQRMGGASNLARLLHETLLSQGVRSAFTYEISQPAGDGTPLDAATEYPCVGGDHSQRPEEGEIVHVHAAADPDAVISSLAAAGAKAVVTAHDCSWGTGGCVYPLGCERWREGCPLPCPQQVENAEVVCRRRRDVLRRLAPAMVSPSKWLADMLRQALPDLTIDVIANATPVKPPTVSKKEAKAAFGIAPRAKVVLFLAHGGALAGYKGGGAFQDIWQAIQHTLPDAVGIIAGGADQSRQDRCITLPYLDSRHLGLVYAAADVLLYPTLADNSPLVILEAMAQHVPVVAFAVGGIPEQIHSGTTGILVPPGDYAALVKMTLHVLATPSLAGRLAQKAALAVRERFDPLIMARQYFALYQARLGVPCEGIL
jgi:glycosyltransferase involved in cell wall biosynthesis